MGGGENPSLLIRGSGALATVFAAQLAPHCRVMMFTPDEGRRKALQKGIERRTSHGTFTAQVEALSGPPHHPVDVVLLLVKSGQIGVACTELAENLREARAVVVLQNGLGAAEEVGMVVKPARLVPGVTYQAATQHEVGLVEHFAEGETVLGATGTNADALALASRLFERAFRTRITKDWEVERWRKLTAATAINGVCAVLDIPVNALTDSASALHLTQTIAEETRTVAIALGYDPDIADVEQFLQMRIAMTGGNLPSMAQDLRAGRTTEVHYINGAVARQAHEAGIPAPLNWEISRLIQARTELGRRREKTYGG